MDEIIYASATQLAKAIRDNRVSSAEVVDAYLSRIEEVNPRLNAVVQLTADSARAQAGEADSALARGEVMGPLHGVPMTIKDAFETAGVVSTGGTQGRADFVPSRDATAVARLKAAGGIMLGKTNLPELSLVFESDNAVYGRANNPYDPSRTPGGSTGGEAAIIAAGGSPVGLGSDAGGSVRLPCHYCGIAGLKPNTGRVPRTGHWPPFNGALDALTQPGPMARRVEDLILTLPIIAGVDWRDPAIVAMPLGDPQKVKMTDLKVAFYTDNGIATPTAETVDIVNKAVKALSDGGVAVEEARPSVIGESFDLLLGLVAADGGAGIRATLQGAGTTEAHPLLERLLGVSPEKATSTAEFASLLVRLDEFRSEMLSFMEGYDAIVCPANARPAMPHGETLDSENMPAFSYTYTYNLTGWPAVVVRGGTSPEGLPIGVQVAAQPWREDVALAVAQFLETALGGYRPPPL